MNTLLDDNEEAMTEHEVQYKTLGRGMHGRKEIIGGTIAATDLAQAWQLAQAEAKDFPIKLEVLTVVAKS